MKRLLPLTLVFLMAAVLRAGDTVGVFRPNLIFLTGRAAAADDTVSGRARVIVADSARVVSPKVRTVISERSAIYQIEPMLPVDSAKLFVRHSGVVDTLGVFAAAPYRAVWDCSEVLNQDQIHLQFGYALYSGDTLAVVSAPMPHRWALDRGRRPSRKKYRVEQLTHPGNFHIDGDLYKWKRVRGAEIGGVGEFKMLWTSARLYFFARVYDNSVTPGDFVELHTDIRRDRSSFSGINHRSLRFGPTTRSSSFVVELTDSGFVRSDSVNALLREEMEWKAVVDAEGYVIEAAIPFLLLADLEFPPGKIGIDVTVVDVDAGGGSTGEFYSWAGNERFFRYSPSGWGTAKVVQAAAAIKAVFIFVIVITCLIPVAFIAHVALSKKTAAREAEDIEALRALMPPVVRDFDDDEDDDDDEEEEEEEG